MAKLERYIGQLVDDRGGVDDSVLENIVKDVERSSRVKSALKKVGGTYARRLLTLHRISFVFPTIP